MKVSLAMAAVTIVLATGGCMPMQEKPTTLAASPQLNEARRELAAEPAESDAAWILSAALDEASRAAPSQRDAIVQAARQRAQEARQFRIEEESPLPNDWPRPSLPGLIRIKKYPPVRAAWVRAENARNRQFMTLFRHIESRQIAMTAPVVMEYDANAVGEIETGTKAMAFLYRRGDQDKAGRFGAVQVENDQPVTVVSIGLKGAYREAKFRKAADELRDWLKAHPQWRATGPPRVLAYNSPFLLWWRKYAEVQVPVRPAAAGEP